MGRHSFKVLIWQIPTYSVTHNSHNRIRKCWLFKVHPKCLAILPFYRSRFLSYFCYPLSADSRLHPLIRWQSQAWLQTTRLVKDSNWLSQWQKYVHCSTRVNGCFCFFYYLDPCKRRTTLNPPIDAFLHCCIGLDNVRNVQWWQGLVQFDGQVEDWLVFLHLHGP